MKNNNSHSKTGKNQKKTQRYTKLLTKKVNWNELKPKTSAEIKIVCFFSVNIESSDLKIITIIANIETTFSVCLFVFFFFNYFFPDKRKCIVRSIIVGHHIISDYFYYCYDHLYLCLSFSLSLSSAASASDLPLSTDSLFLTKWTPTSSTTTTTKYRKYSFRCLLRIYSLFFVLLLSSKSFIYLCIIIIMFKGRC